MIITRSYKFKILPTNQQKVFLEDYFSRFAKAVIFASKKILVIEKKFYEEYELIKNGLDGICSYCKKRYKSCKNHRPEGKNKRDRNKICTSCKQNSLLNRKNKTNKINKNLICQKCWNKEFSIRKILYATKGRKRSVYGDIRDAAKLPGTEYALAFKRAADTLKSYKRQVKKIENTIKYKQRRIKEWEEVLINRELKISELKDRYKNNKSISEVLNSLTTKKVFARFTLARQPKQKLDRYKHIIYKNNPSKGKTESSIKSIIKALSKTEEKLRKRLKETKINFRGNIVDLQDTAVKAINEKFVELSIDKRQERFMIAALNVASRKSKDWLLDVLNKIKEGALRYPLLLRSNENFYLSYPIREDLEELKIDTKSRVMGIDRGVNQIAVTAVLNKFNDKPLSIKFYSGRDLMRQKLKYQLIRKKFTATKSINKRYTKFGKKVGRISDYLLHDISRKIINQAKDMIPIVIAMENLKMIQGEKRVKKGPAKFERKINFKLSNFVYGKLQNLIEYKAALAGIPVRFIQPEYTSQLCSICHQVGDRRKGFFICTDKDCGHKMNADLNAAINIANSLYKQLKS